MSVDKLLEKYLKLSQDYDTKMSLELPIFCLFDELSIRKFREDGNDLSALALAVAICEHEKTLYPSLIYTMYQCALCMGRIDAATHFLIGYVEVTLEVLHKEKNYR